MYSSYYDGKIVFTDLSEIELGSKPSPFSKDSYSKIAYPEDIFHSILFKKIITESIHDLKDNDDELYDYFSSTLENIEDDLISITSLLLYVKRENIIKDYPPYAKMLSDNGKHMEEFLHLLMNLYLKKEKFCYLESSCSCIEIIEKKMASYRDAVLFVMRQALENIRCRPTLNNLELNCGYACGLLVEKNPVNLGLEYEYLRNIPFVKRTTMVLPYLTNTEKNKRIGVYKESEENLAANLPIKENEWLAFPFKVGDSLVYFYSHISFLNNVIGAINLFKLASYEEIKGKKPNIVIVFGGERGNTTGTYYIDRYNDLLVGYVSRIKEADYFGYVKKLILTLHNIRMIKRKALPIHGSMMNVIMKNGKHFSIVIMGDSGAGKSESIEAFRRLAKEYLKDIEVIFDDMGTLLLTEEGVRAIGTETGAFVRIDDLGIGYTFTHLNDSIIYNAEKSNARIVYRCTPYSEVTKEWKINIFLYANNYEETDKGVLFFKNHEEVAKICEEGKRKAKGTTGEIGMTSTYFANPFGPVQYQEETHALVKKMFAAMRKEKIALGVMYTQLAIEGKGEKGPEEAARKLFEWINKEGYLDNE